MHRVTSAAVATAAIAACGDSAVHDNFTCDNGDLIDGPISPDRDLRGFVVIRDVVDVRIDPDGTKRNVRMGLVQGGFGDFWAATSSVASLLPLGPRCVGVTSRAQTAGRVPLRLAGLVVDGTGRGRIVVHEITPGTFVSSGTPLLQGADVLEVRGDQGSFPGFTAKLASLVPIVPVPSDEAVGPDGLEVFWMPSDTDWVEITLSPPATASRSGGQVVCRVADTGCYAIPAAATSFLLTDDGSHYTLTVDRVRYRVVEPDLNSAVEISVRTRHHSTLQRGGLE